jgi:hypothetical protein
MVDMKLEEALSPAAADKTYLDLAKMKEKYAAQLIANKSKKEADKPA